MFFEIKKRLGKNCFKLKNRMICNQLQIIRFLGLCQMVLMTSKTSLQKWSGVFLFPSVSPVFFQIGTVTYQHRLRFRWRRFMYEFLPLIRKARTRCDLCRALHDFARLRLTSQCLPAGNYGWRKCIQRGCLKNTSSVSFWSAQCVSWSYQDSWIQSNCVSDSWFCGLFLQPDCWRNHTRRC